MIYEKTLNVLEYDKVLHTLSEYAVLFRTKNDIINFKPVTDYKEVKVLLDKTEEAFKLLYTYSLPVVFFCDEISDEIKRAESGGTLNNGELLKVASNLKSARLLKTSFSSFSDDSIVLLPEIASRLFTFVELENEITSKIISVDEISDNASKKLFEIRKNIKNLNVRIREQLNSYMRGGFSKYLQDSVITMRQDRYVIPVKSEYRSFVKGFIHDQSSTGSTVFIEPEMVMQLNNDLKKAMFDEKEEIYRILSELSTKVSGVGKSLLYNLENISEIDAFFARAEYAFKNKCTKPLLNNKGIINIKKGRHPLINKDKVIPVSLNLGDKYNCLLITGPNTGGKTVTLKLAGLMALMTMSGMFIPCEEESEISVFNNVFCDIGDEQSIEQNLSTFSSHIKNIINIIENIDDKCFVLLDEIGAGTDPDEGSALALSIIKKLIEKNCFGIITTHYSKLKEFAMDNGKIENASMGFDAKTLSPLYKLNIGIPGSSNAIDIAKTLGLPSDIISDAYSQLSDKQIGFEKVLKKAEETKIEAENLKDELEKIKAEQQDKLNEIQAEKDKITLEREKIYNSARQETKRIVADKLSEAEEIIDELKSILKRANLESKELFKAGELRNRLKNSKYLTYDENEPYEMIPVNLKDAKIGDSVYVKSLGAVGEILSIKTNKKEIEVLVLGAKTKVKETDCFNKTEKQVKNQPVKVYKKSVNIGEKAEINVVGKNSFEALEDVKNFIDKSIVSGFTEIKIIHGVGQGILLKSIREYLKSEKNIKSFRRGNYGEGENGVTIVELK